MNPKAMFAPIESPCMGTAGPRACVDLAGAGHGAADLHRRSAGAFDVTSHRCCRIWDCFRVTTRSDHQLQPTEVTAARHRVVAGAARSLQHRETQIDLGGIAKGFAVDRAMMSFSRHGMRRGTDQCRWVTLRRSGLVPLRHRCSSIPAIRAAQCVVISLRDAALASSGATSILSFREPVARQSSIRAAAMWSNRCWSDGARASCMLADALTKVVMVAGRGAGQLLDHYGADAIMVYADGGMEMTCGLQTAVCLAA